MMTAYHRATSALIEHASGPITISRADLADLIAQIETLQTPTMFWLDETPEDGTRDWDDVVDDADIDAVTKFLTARDLPPRWGATRVVSVDADGDPDETCAELFETHAEAQCCYPDSLAAARANAGLANG